MSGEKTIKCKICGKPYKIYQYYAGDQSACPSCRREASVRSVWADPWRNDR